MINLLSAAMAGVGQVLPNVGIVLIKRESVMVDGIQDIAEVSVPAVAHVQPASNQDVKEFGTYLNASLAYKFYINGNRADVVNFFESPETANTVIEYQAKRYKVFSKTNWNAAGWIKVIGVLNDDLPSDI